MIIIKKFTALKIETNIVNKDLVATFTHGKESGPHYNRSCPDTEFDTEEEAVECAFKQSPYGTWLIIPVIRFKN